MSNTTNTPKFLSLMRDSLGRNQGPKTELALELDPDGVHVLTFVMPHNDREWRGLWLVKLRGTMTPLQILMDNGFKCLADALGTTQIGSSHIPKV